MMIRAYRTERPSGWIGALPGGHRLVLRVPSRCELEVTTTTGSISVAGVAGPKKLAADTGSIAVRESPGPIAATTTTGSHAYSSVKGDVAARANTGGVRLDAVQGALSVTTHTGRIEGTGLVLTDDSSFEADTGSISLELDQTLDSFSFQLRSDTGRILVGDTEARGRLALGGGRTRLRAETDTGGIRIQGK